MQELPKTYRCNRCKTQTEEVKHHILYDGSERYICPVCGDDDVVKDAGERCQICGGLLFEGDVAYETTGELYFCLNCLNEVMM